MTEYPQLSHISVAMLIEHVGGDPWTIDQTLQDGEPGEIAELSRAFFNAGACTTETVDEFINAQSRFKEAWNHENGDHPINDSAEVQRAMNSLIFQRDSLPVVAAKLAGIAAALAEAQRSSEHQISVLDSKLRYIDDLIGEALARRQQVWLLEDSAIAEAQQALDQVRSLRDGYTNELNQVLTALRLDCKYDPAIEDVDGDAAPGPEQRGRDSVEHYDANQRAKDEALVHGGGPQTPEKAAAAARLNDFAVATDTTASEEARQLAAERLDDFRMSQFVGPLPTDPILGQDARARAQSRLDLQRQLEAGAFGLPPMTRDQATRELDEGEHFARITAVQQAMFSLTRAGVSQAGARSIVEQWGKQTSEIADKVGLGAGGVEKHSGAIPTGKHAKPVGPLSAEDAARWGTIAGRVGTAGNLVQLGVAVAQLADGGDDKWQEFGGAVGGVAGGSAAGWGAAMVAGSFTGPWTTAGIFIAASLLGNKAGSQIGEGLGGLIDPPVVTSGGSGGRSW